MTKKHFKAIAEIISEHNLTSYIDPKAAIRSIAEELADFCATTNPHFDRAKFLEACGIE